MPHSSIAGAADRYDAVVIGSGLGGLTLANSLAKAGYTVLLAEHHYRLGGLATWFRRKGHIFDVSLHGFPFGMIKTCRKYWNRTIMESIVQLKEIVFDNPQFSLRTTFDKESFTEIMVRQFGVGRAIVDDFFRAVASMNFYDDRSMTTRELLESFFPGRTDIFRLLMEPITYANGSSLEDPAITYGIVFSNFMNKGVYTFSGGTDKLIGLMVEELEKNGVTICTRSKVDRIVVEERKVRGVQIGDRMIASSCVVSNAGIMNTIDELVGREAFSRDFVDRLASVKVNNSSAQVYMGIRDGEAIDPIGDLLFTSTAPEFDSEELLDMKTKSRTFSVYYPRTRPGRNRYTIVASMNARYGDWVGLSPDSYRREKEDLIERSLVDLERYIPDIREKCDWFEAATPKTFHRYTLHTEGSSFGTKFEGLEVSRGIFKDIGGLFHVGSVGIIMSGWLGAINYGVIVANDVDAFLRG